MTASGPGVRRGTVQSGSQGVRSTFLSPELKHNWGQGVILKLSQTLLLWLAHLQLCSWDLR